MRNSDGGGRCHFLRNTGYCSELKLYQDTFEIPIYTCTNFRLGDGSFVHSVRSVILCAVPQFGLNLFDFWELNGAGDIIL
jgi:hypothetical protein